MMTPEVQERALQAIEMRRRNPTPTWRAIAAELGVHHATLIQSVDRWYATRDHLMDLSRRAEEHRDRLERSITFVRDTLEAIEEPAIRAGFLGELRAILMLEAQEVGAISREGTAPAVTINNLTGASANAVSAPMGDTSELQRFVRSIVAGSRGAACVDVHEGNGNGTAGTNGDAHAGDDPPGEA